MPIYEYACQKCGHQLEVMQKISDKPLTKCPECRGKLEKLISPPSIQFKGSGWYVTDYSGRGKAEKAEPGEKKSEGEKTGTAEKKPASEKKEASEKKDKKDKKEAANTNTTSKSD